MIFAYKFMAPRRILTTISFWTEMIECRECTASEIASVDPIYFVSSKIFVISMAKSIIDGYKKIEADTLCEEGAQSFYSLWYAY